LKKKSKVPFSFFRKKETKKARVSLIHSPPKKYYFKIIKTAFSKTLIFCLWHRCTKNQFLLRKKKLTAIKEFRSLADSARIFLFEKNSPKSRC